MRISLQVIQKVWNIPKIILRSGKLSLLIHPNQILEYQKIFAILFKSILDLLSRKLAIL